MNKLTKLDFDSQVLYPPVPFRARTSDMSYNIDPGSCFLVEIRLSVSLLG